MTKPLPHTRRIQRPSAASRLWRSVAGFLGKPVKNPPEAKKAGGRPVAQTKAQTALLQPFAGLSPDRIHVPKTKAECEAAADEILAAGIAGFDTEAKPTFRVGEKSGGPHVVQFALTDKAFVFQLHHRDCLKVAAGLIASEHVLKVGFGLRNDHGQIRNRLGVKPNAVLDLDHIFRKRGYPGQIGVRAAMGAVLNLSFPKSKATTTSNWAAAELTPRQLRYAANDAYAALKIMEALDLKPTEIHGHRHR
ncbi:MAG: 3'-5' exonuclease [Verrucomicrobiae bacterium]